MLPELHKTQVMQLTLLLGIDFSGWFPGKEPHCQGLVNHGRGSVHALIWVAALLILVQMTFALLLSQAGKAVSGFRAV